MDKFGRLLEIREQCEVDASARDEHRAGVAQGQKDAVPDRAASHHVRETADEGEDNSHHQADCGDDLAGALVDLAVDQRSVHDHERTGQAEHQRLQEDSLGRMGQHRHDAVEVMDDMGHRRDAADAHEDDGEDQASVDCLRFWALTAQLAEAQECEQRGTGSGDRGK